MEVRSQVLMAYSLMARDPSLGNEASLRRLVGRQGPLGGITAACVLLSARDLLERVVPRLLTQLNRSTHPRPVELRGRARGTIDWGATVKARSSQRQDPTIFVCRQSWRLYDLPENRLLKYLLDRLQRYRERTPAELRPWIWSPAETRGGTQAVRLEDQLERFANRLSRFAKNAYLRDVELPPAIDSEHLRAARSCRNPFYQEAAEFYEHSVCAVEKPTWASWQQMLRRTAILLPAEEARALEGILTPTGRQPEGS
ncbi:MAG: hypothetical protein K0U98_25265 [Deltaproteobacteria bacterium]|nr:hypothetical protein [Deltaproteobacteria bacterium]